MECYSLSKSQEKQLDSTVCQLARKAMRGLATKKVVLKDVELGRELLDLLPLLVQPQLRQLRLRRLRHHLAAGVTTTAPEPQPDLQPLAAGRGRWPRPFAAAVGRPSADRWPA